MTRLSGPDRELLMRLPLTEVVPVAMKGVSAAQLHALKQVVDLRRRGLITVTIDADASARNQVVRHLSVTPAGTLALHAAGPG